MGGIFDIINIPLGYLFRFIFMVVKNYGWTLILFTIITKAILLPLTIKQQKSMSKMQAIQPKLAELQKKYQYDQEKLNQETMKLYQTHKINPMGGCLPLLIQFPILIALYNIIRSPLTYVVQLGKHGLPTLTETMDVLATMGLEVSGKIINEIPVAKFLFEHFDAALEKLPSLAGALTMEFNFLGMDLSLIPSLNNVNPLLLIPILAGLTTFLSSWLTQKMSGNANASKDNQNAQTMQMMNYIFPFMTVFFAFSLPAGLGLYWIISNIVQFVQQIVLTKIFAKKIDEDAPQKEHFRERENKRRKK